MVIHENNLTIAVGLSEDRIQTFLYGLSAVPVDDNKADFRLIHAYVVLVKIIGANFSDNELGVFNRLEV